MTLDDNLRHLGWQEKSQLLDDVVEYANLQFATVKSFRNRVVMDHHRNLILKRYDISLDTMADVYVLLVNNDFMPGRYQIGTENDQRRN